MLVLKRSYIDYKANCKKVTSYTYECDTVKDFRNFIAQRRKQCDTFIGCIDSDYFYQEWFKETDQGTYIMFIRLI